MKMYAKGFKDGIEWAIENVDMVAMRGEDENEKLINIKDICPKLILPKCITKLNTV